MTDIGYGDKPGGQGTSSRELRRTYHDRIGELRERSLQMLRYSIAGTASAVHCLEVASPSGTWAGCRPQDAQVLAAMVDEEAVSLLALESPMARDLRVILASRDVTQIGLLCVGLANTLQPRVQRTAASLQPDVKDLLARITEGTANLSKQAESAWVALDEVLAAGVEVSASAVRKLQTDFVSALVALTGVPMDVAIDLAMVARALERLVDHAVEVAERVLFVVYGRSAAPPAL